MTEREEVTSWIGCRLDDVYGAKIGRVCGVYVDRDTDEPRWLLVRTGRTRADYHAVPRSGAACGNGRVWIGLMRGNVLASPPIVVRRPLSRAMEAALCRHYELPDASQAQPHRHQPSTLVVVGDARDPGAWAAMVATGTARLPAPLPDLSFAT